MINKVTLIGHLGRDPEIRHLENGTAVGKFSVATSEKYKDKNGEWQSQTEWHDVVVWRNLAERAEKDLKKGKLVYIEGKLTHRKYQDKEGVERYTTEIVANTFRLLEKREGGGNFNPTGFPTDEPHYVSSVNTPPAQINDAPSAGEDDLPF
jgi:single-strand DNA-binding protein